MRTIGSLLALLAYGSLMAGNDAELFYISGKIYVVVTVLLLIFGGIIAYLIRLDKKIQKIEKQNEA